MAPPTDDRICAEQAFDLGLCSRCEIAQGNLAHGPVAGIAPGKCRDAPCQQNGGEHDRDELAHEFLPSVASRATTIRSVRLEPEPQTALRMEETQQDRAPDCFKQD